MSLPFPSYPCWTPERGRELRFPVTVIIVVIVVAALAGWTPLEVLRLLALLFPGS